MSRPPVRDEEALLRAHERRIKLLERRLVGGVEPSRLGPEGHEVTDWDDATEVGFYWGTSASNQPPGPDTWWVGITQSHGGSRRLQTLFQPSHPGFAPAQRSYDGSVWSAWSVGLSEALPARQSWYGNGVLNISATSWGDVTGSGLTFNLPRPCRVIIALNAWVVASAGELRVGVAADGAGVFSPTTIGWGAVLFRSPLETSGTAQRSASFSRDLPAGTTTIKVQAYQTGGGTKQLNYPVLDVAPVAWVD